MTGFASRLGLSAFTCVRLVHRVVPNPICPLAVGRKQVELHTPLILMLICGGCVAFWRFPKQRWKVDACLPLLRAFGVVVILWVAAKKCGTQEAQPPPPSRSNKAQIRCVHDDSRLGLSAIKCVRLMYWVISNLICLLTPGKNKLIYTPP